MSFPNRDAQILAHILEYCNRIERTLSRFGRNFDIFLEDQDYMDSVSMNLLQIGEQCLIGQLTRRDVYRHAQIDSLIAPLRHLAHNIQNHPAPQRDDKP